MTTLRTTRPGTDRTRPAHPRGRRTRWLWAVACVALVGLCGCGADPRPADEPVAGVPPAELATRDRSDKGPKLPPPASDQIEYDKVSRTLTFYELPNSARWMVQMPGAAVAVPTAARHRLPPGIDPDRTLVFYIVPGGHPSSPVSLRQIEKAQGKGHTSQVH
ncbi:MAG TPA: hypothetical protein VKE74_30335 [Gemmataceae bacterium]|nr:hypothetical protein [Gemmataceae bacterium]